MKKLTLKLKDGSYTRLPKDIADLMIEQGTAVPAKKGALKCFLNRNGKITRNQQFVKDNRIQFPKNPGKSDNLLFQEGRKVIAYLQETIGYSMFKRVVTQRLIMDYKPKVKAV